MNGISALTTVVVCRVIQRCLYEGAQRVVPCRDSIIASRQPVAGALRDIPNIVLLFAGTNNEGYASSPAGTSTQLGALVDKIVAALPDAQLVVFSIYLFVTHGWATPGMACSSRTGTEPMRSAVAQVLSTQNPHWAKES